MLQVPGTVFLFLDHLHYSISLQLLYKSSPQWNCCNQPRVFHKKQLKKFSDVLVPTSSRIQLDVQWDFFSSACSFLMNSCKADLRSWWRSSRCGILHQRGWRQNPSIYNFRYFKDMLISFGAGCCQHHLLIWYMFCMEMKQHIEANQSEEQTPKVAEAFMASSVMGSSAGMWKKRRQPSAVGSKAVSI